MKKIFAVASLLIGLVMLTYAQSTAPDPALIGVDSSQQRLKEVSISKFEDPAFWRVIMPSDQGVVTARQFEGAPLDKKPIPDEANTTEADKNVLGIKAEFFGRATTRIAIEPIRPIALPGITKLISVWVVGRNFNHMLRVVVEDNFGSRQTLQVGRLNFFGWKKMTVAVPPTLIQQNPNYSNRNGIRIVAFVIDPELTETIGSYFVYFDDLRIVTDLFAEESRDPDDMADNW